MSEVFFRMLDRYRIESMYDDVLYSQLTRGGDPMLIYCWVAVCDAGPTLNQHQVNIPCLLDLHAATDIEYYSTI